MNVGGLVASTLDLSDQDLAAGNFAFAGKGGRVTNHGSITANGGYVALLGAQVSNEGTLTARLGSAAWRQGTRSPWTSPATSWSAWKWTRAPSRPWPRTSS